MSELKRVAPQTLEFSSTLANSASNKKEKCEKIKKLAPSFRFELSVGEKNEKGYTEFNYAHLLKAAEKKRNKEAKNAEENPANGLDPFDDNDDDQKLREIAKRFETKYGGTTVGKNRKKYDDDVDLGAGYDENDSFIDNTDAYDEVVPEGVTTAYGGFYINSGPLEFSVKAAERNSLLHRNNNNNNNNNHENESSESSDDEIDNSNSPVSKRRDNRSIISSSDDDEPEEIPSEPPAKKSKIDENGEKKQIQQIPELPKKKKKLINEDLERDNNYRPKNPIVVDEKRETVEIDIIDANDDKKKSKIDLTKKDKKFDIKKFEKKSTTNGIEEKKILEVKKTGGKDKLSGNIDDAIESVVNDGKEDDESSRDTVYSSKSRGAVGSSSEGEENDRSELSLIEQLPEEIKDIINQLKKLAANRKEGKIKFFDANVNSTLLLLEKNLRKLDSSTARSQVYSHIGYILDVGKVTLLNRAKKLSSQDAESRVKGPMQRLKAIIENVMPMAVEKYNAECQRLTEEKSFPPSVSDADSSEVDDKMLEKSKIPRKRFPWTSEARKLVSEIGAQWRQYYAIRKPRKVSADTFVGSFMESKVLPLWPTGWMKLDTLLKYSNAEQSVKRKQKKRETPPRTISSLPAASAASLDPISTSVPEPEKSAPIYSKPYCDPPPQKPSESPLEKKQTATKYKEKHKESGPSHAENPQSLPIAKISVVPTAQLMAQKPKNHEKFNPMDLTSTSLSITPVNDYQKPAKPSNEPKKDVVSITPYSESSLNLNESSKNDLINYTNQNSGKSAAAAMKQRLLHEDGKEKREENERKRERWLEEKKSESKKRRTEQKLLDAANAKDVASLLQQPLLSREEQEQRQIEETMAATNYLSQIINDDAPRLPDKRKEGGMLGDEGMGVGVGVVQPSEQEKDVQMVMRSLKELQELQSTKSSSNQYATFNEDYHRIYHKKEDKLRVAKEDQW